MRISRGWPRRTRVVIMLVAGGAASCAPGPDFVRPAAPQVSGYLSASAGAGPTGPRLVEGATVPADWWKRFNAPALDAIVEASLLRNQTLASAHASLRQSDDELRAGYGVFLPSVGIDLSATRQRLSPLRLGQSGPGSVFNLFTLTGSVGYVLDLFGGARRQTESLRAAVDVERNRVRATYVTLTANVVNTSIARAGYRAQISTMQVRIDDAAESLRLVEAKERAGAAAFSSVLTARAKLASLEAAGAPLRIRADQADHLLATLAGRMPAEWTAPDVPLVGLEVPTDLPLSVPSDLVRQRPDILEAEARLHVASAQVGVATAGLFPTLTLSGSLGRNTTEWPQFGGPNSRFWSTGADASVPVFEGGRSWYGRRAAIAAYEAALADYRQTVLTAFQQVADTLRSLAEDSAAAQAQADGAAAAARTLDMARANYSAGVVDYLAVLSASGDYEASQSDVVAGKVQQLQDVVALFVALGGGWWSAAPAAAESHPGI